MGVDLGRQESWVTLVGSKVTDREDAAESVVNLSTDPLFLKQQTTQIYIQSDNIDTFTQQKLGNKYYRGVCYYVILCPPDPRAEWGNIVREIRDNATRNW